LSKIAFLPTINGTLDVFVQDNDTSDDSRRSRNVVANFNSNIAISDRTSATVGLLFNDNEDFIGDASRRSRQARFGLRRSVKLFGFDGSVNGGFVVRDLDASDGRDVDFGPNVDLSLKRQAHSLRFNANYLSQQPGGDAEDIDTFRYGMRYTYQKGPHEFQLHASVDRRLPEIQERTESIRFGANYRLRFQKTPRSQRANNRVASAAIQSQSIAQSADGFKIDQLMPGAEISKAFSVLQAAGASGAVPFGDALVFERPYFNQIQNRQRLVIMRDSTQSVLETAAIVRGEQGLRRLIDQVRDELTRDYGRPHVVEQGQIINGNVREAILDGEFIYLAEWVLPDGDLRLGIPVRLDGQIRLEVQYKAAFPSAGDTDWSINDVF